MPRLRPILRRDPVALALLTYDIWRRLPKKQRKQALKLLRKYAPELGRKYGPQVAAKVFNSRKKP
jgi:hypothetical protein